jgi:hypothetical protein
MAFLPELVFAVHPSTTHSLKTENGVAVVDFPFLFFDEYRFAVHSPQ